MIKHNRGFTIVEIIVVVTVVAILAAISIVAYNGVHRRTQDAIRVQDLNSILKAINIYKTQNGSFPAITTPSANRLGGWDNSSLGAATFLSALVPTYTQIVPLDPVNNDGINGGRFGYRYYVYSAGSHDCDASRGPYFVLVGRTDNAAKKLDGHQGFSCTSRSWDDEGSWVVGGFLLG